MRARPFRAAAEIKEFDANPDKRVAILSSVGDRAFSSGADVTDLPELWRSIPTIGFNTDKPIIAASMFGNTTACVEHARKLLERAGYEVLVFHATGTGGRTMERLALALALMVIYALLMPARDMHYDTGLYHLPTMLATRDHAVTAASP